MNRKSDFISLHRQRVTELLEVMGELEQLRLEWDSLNYVDDEEGITQGDFVGENANITKQQLTDAVSSVGAITTLLSQGHRTNLYYVIM